MSNTQLYDFYTKDTNTHFERERMTEKEAEAYAKKYQLYYKVIK